MIMHTKPGRDNKERYHPHNSSLAASKHMQRHRNHYQHDSQQHKNITYHRRPIRIIQPPSHSSRTGSISRTRRYHWCITLISTWCISGSIRPRLPGEGTGRAAFGLEATQLGATAGDSIIYLGGCLVLLM